MDEGTVTFRGARGREFRRVPAPSVHETPHDSLSGAGKRSVWSLIPGQVRPSLGHTRPTADLQR